jgi:hypothetical protein
VEQPGASRCRAPRGMLCNACNTSLGRFRDDPAVIRRAAQYLEDDAEHPRYSPLVSMMLQIRPYASTKPQRNRVGTFEFRRVVPKDLKEVIGKWEVSISLRTKDPEEAAFRNAQVAMKVDAEWEALREAHAITGGERWDVDALPALPPLPPGRTKPVRNRCGGFEFRRSVPERLRVIVGKREVTVSLRTKDLRVAAERHAQVVAKMDAAWKVGGP